MLPLVLIYLVIMRDTVVVAALVGEVPITLMMMVVMGLRVLEHLICQDV